jgi:hypothetical protein
LQDFELGDDEDEKTFQKFKAKEGRRALFWDNLWNYLDPNLADAIGKQRLVMINWIMEVLHLIYPIFQKKILIHLKYLTFN